jgi:hypothetical protein
VIFPTEARHHTEGLAKGQTLLQYAIRALTDVSAAKCSSRVCSCTLASFTADTSPLAPPGVRSTFDSLTCCHSTPAIRVGRCFAPALQGSRVDLVQQSLASNDEQVFPPEIFPVWLSCGFPIVFLRRFAEAVQGAGGEVRRDVHARATESCVRRAHQC